MRAEYWPCVTNRREGLYLVALQAASDHKYDGEERPLAAAPPASSEGSHAGGKRGF